MDTGIPELGMPPLDPINIDIIEFKFFNLTISFNNVLMNGFKNFTVKKSVMDKKKRSCFTCSAKVDYIWWSRTWDIELSIPRVTAAGVYIMSGTVPPNLDLGTSTGDERLHMLIILIRHKTWTTIFKLNIVSVGSS